MGLTKKEHLEHKDIFAATKRGPMYSKKDCRQNLQRNIVRMFSDNDDNR